MCGVICMARKIQTTILLPPDLYDRLEGVKEEFGSSHNFVIERALRLFFAEDVEMIKKALKEAPARGK